jgi:hypothetical protein
VLRCRYSGSVADLDAVWTIFTLVFLIASLPTNLVYILIFFFVELGFLLVSASYFAVADGHPAASVNLKKGGGAFCFLAGLVGFVLSPSKLHAAHTLTSHLQFYRWYLTFALLLNDSIVELPLGDTSRFFAKRKTQ